MNEQSRPGQSPLTKTEKQALRRNSFPQLVGDIAKTLLFAWFVISALFFAVLFSLWKWMGWVRFEEEQLVFLILSCVLAFLFILRIGLKDIKYLSELKRKLTPINQDIKNGYASVERYEVIRAVEIEEYEDEGTGFFLELNDGRVLSIIGQDLYEYSNQSIAQPEEGIEDRRSLFPHDRIEYRYTPITRRRLDVKGVGTTLCPYGIVKSHTGLFKKDRKTKVRTYIGPEDGCFYEGPMEKVLEKFSYTLKEI